MLALSRTRTAGRRTSCGLPGSGRRFRVACLLGRVRDGVTVDRAAQQRRWLPSPLDFAYLGTSTFGRRRP